MESAVIDGAVIASQADAADNRLDTGTLGFTDIHNEADYKVSHSGISLSAGGGASLASNAMSNMGNVLAGLNGKGHAEGTTQSAVADGTIIVRDQANQQQDVNDLSRDTEHANDSISPIFNKEKEQKRLQTAQLVGEISGQMASIVNTVGDIKAMEAANEKMGPVPEGLSEKDRAAEVEKRRSSDYYQTAIRDYGIGSKNQMVVQAITGVLQGLVSGNITQAVAGGVSPLMAQTIKAYTTNPDGTTNTAANLMAHAVWGAVAAQMSGGNAAAGAGGAFSAELAARYITENYYNAKTPEEIRKLSESDRQEISLLSTLAAGAAGGVVGDSTAAVTTGAQTGKNAVENNALGDTCPKGSPLLMGACGGGSGSNVMAGAVGAAIGLGIAAGMSDDDSKADNSQPNTGKNLTDPEKAELGGAGSGTPGGHGPEDEENARNTSNSSNPTNRAQHEDYVDSLRASMEKPNVKDENLKNLIDDLYRPNAKIGSGSTADAVRYEMATGEKVGGRGHVEKAQTYSKALQDWLNKNPQASQVDRSAAENVLKDMQNALKGK